MSTVRVSSLLGAPGCPEPLLPGVIQRATPVARAFSRALTIALWASRLRSDGRTYLRRAVNNKMIILNKLEMTHSDLCFTFMGPWRFKCAINMLFIPLAFSYALFLLVSKEQNEALSKTNDLCGNASNHIDATTYSYHIHTTKNFVSQRHLAAHLPPSALVNEGFKA